MFGLVNGGLLGDGVLVEGRESGRISFRRLAGFLGAPDRGELFIEQATKGETRVRFELRCGTLLARAVGGGSGLALLAAAPAVTVGPWWSAWCCGAAAIGLVAATVLWTMARRRLVGRARAFISNARYLKPL